MPGKPWESCSLTGGWSLTAFSFNYGSRVRFVQGSRTPQDLFQPDPSWRDRPGSHTDDPLDSGWIQHESHTPIDG